MKELTIERVLQRIGELEKAESCNMISIHCEFELSCLRKLIVLMGYDIHPNALMQTTIKLVSAGKRIAELESQVMQPVKLPDICSSEYYTEDGYFMAFDYKRDLKSAIRDAGGKVE